MNVAAHQEEKNEKTGKKKAGEQRRQADFKEAVCYSFAVVLGGCTAKKMICVRGVPGVTRILGKTNNVFHSTKTGLGTAPPRLGGY